VTIHPSQRPALPELPPPQPSPPTHAHTCMGVPLMMTRMPTGTSSNASLSFMRGFFSLCPSSAVRFTG
jgi:hypothetical protein